jgi:PKD repeat protein
VAADAGFAGVIADTGRVDVSGAPAPPSFHAATVGPGILQFASSYWARTKVWDMDGTEQFGWSAPVSFSTPGGPYPQAQFTFEPANPAAGQEIQFTDQSLNGPTAWLWGFGDGGTDMVQHPVYTYAASGSYTVTLQVTNANGFCQTSRNIGLQEALPQFKEVRP